MGHNISPADLTGLPIDERLELVETLWDSIAKEADSVPLPDWHGAELDARLKSHEADPLTGVPWSDVRQRMADRIKPR